MRPIGFATTVVVLLCAGCAMSEKIKLGSDGAPEYRKLHVVYERQPESGFAGLDRPADVEQAGFDTDEANADKSDTKSDKKKRIRASNTRLRLEIEYPHAGINPEFARATLCVVPGGDNRAIDLRGVSNSGKRFIAPPAARTEVSDEILVFDLPKTQLDGLLVELARQGFFGAAKSESGESRLDLTLNRGEVGKKWQREPRLDELISLLRRRGKPSTLKSI